MKLSDSDKRFLKVDVPLGIIILGGYSCMCAPFIIYQMPHRLPYNIALACVIMVGVALIGAASKRQYKINKECKQNMKKGEVMNEFDRIVELKALQSDKEIDKNVEVLQYAFLVVMDKSSYKNGTVTTRLSLLKEAFGQIKSLVIQDSKK